jgi:hypothetical protein
MQSYCHRQRGCGAAFTVGGVIGVISCRSAHRPCWASGPAGCSCCECVASRLVYKPFVYKRILGSPPPMLREPGSLSTTQCTPPPPSLVEKRSSKPCWSGDYLYMAALLARLCCTIWRVTLGLGWLLLHCLIKLHVLLYGALPTAYDSLLRCWRECNLPSVLHCQTAQSPGSICQPFTVVICRQLAARRGCIVTCCELGCVLVSRPT